TMGYTGNRLTTVTATTEALPFEGRTGLAQTGTYSLTYDDAGNLKSDPSRGISNITYNHLGQPMSIRFSNGNIHSYLRDNLGNVLSIKYEEVVTRPGTTTAYLSQFGEETFHGDGQRTRSSGSISTGKGPAPVMTTFQGGYFDAKGRPRYNVTDYQGNIVAVIGHLGSKVQSSSYYPYGELHRDCIEPLDVDTTGMGLSRQNVAANSLLPGIGGGTGNWPGTLPLGSSMPVLSDATQPHHYSGKELMNIDGQREYDFHARRHNSLGGVFTTMDPQAESYPHLSPYSHCAANPVMFIDPSGERITAEYGNTVYEWKRDDSGGNFYSQGNPYKGYIPFINRLISTFRWMNKTDVGSALLDRALSSKKTIQIISGMKNPNYFFSTSTENKDLAYIHIGTKFAISMVVLRWVTIIWQMQTHNISFAHEMAHAVDWINGTYDATVMYKAGVEVRGAEIWAVEVENYLRYELGLPIRVGYAISPIFNYDLSRGYSYSNTEVSLGENRIIPFWYSQHHFMNTSFIIDKIYQR
ncbi:MAG: hypothetical protein NC095_11565, partial [Muribaculum sp.]|nr:hypothetical protein [Muribaculum sp.]